MRFKISFVVVLSSVLFAAANCYADSNSSTASTGNPWKFEIAPYAWLSGIDGDINLGDKTVSPDIGFSDLLDATDIGGSVLAIARYNRWVFMTQLDYFKLDSNNVNGAPPHARLETASFFGSAVFGYQFEISDASTIDVLGGVRYLDMSNELTIDAIGSGDNDRSLLDGIFMIRPNFQLLDWLAFNFGLAIGGGDSDLTYELQPKFDFKINKTLYASLGYRRLYYDVGSDRKGIDAAFHGLLLGLGFKF